MKKKNVILLLFLVFLAPILCSAQEFTLPSVNFPGGFSVGVFNGAVLSENLIGPRKIIFSGNQMVLQRVETGSKTSGFGVTALNIDKLLTFYSIRIFSEGITESVVFENKTPEELATLEVNVFPKILEQPYTLFIDITVRASSKPVQASQFNQSDDAGKYDAKILITLIEI